MTKKLLIVSESHLVKTFVLRTLQKMREEGLETQIDCLVTSLKNPTDLAPLQEFFDHVYILPEATKWYHKIPKLRVFIQVLRLLNMGARLPKYDYVHFQFMHYYYAILVMLFRLKSRFIYLTFYGSDFNQIGIVRHLFNRISCAFANKLIAENQVFLSQVKSKYDAKNKIDSLQLIPLMPVIENMFGSHETQSRSSAKQFLGFKQTDILITCGYCGDEIMQFDLMIDSIQKLNQNEINGRQIQLVFPMTYGRNYQQNQAYVEQKMQSLNLPFHIYKQYLSNEEVSALRYATDIFVLVSKRDQAASALYEHLLAGSVVITGNWLPYEHLDALNILYRRVPPEQLSAQLNEVLSQLEIEQNRVKQNYSTIRKMIAWEENKHLWFNLYTS